MDIARVCNVGNATLVSIYAWITQSMPTSLLTIGFSKRIRCVNFLKPPSGSRSASSLILFFVSTSVVRFGSCLCSVG